MLQEKTIRYACKQAMNNIYSEGVTDVALIDKPFESIYYKKESPLRKIVIDLVTSRILKNSYEELKLGPLNHILIPKNNMPTIETAPLSIFWMRRFTLLLSFQ